MCGLLMLARRSSGADSAAADPIIATCVEGRVYRCAAEAALRKLSGSTEFAARRNPLLGMLQDMRTEGAVRVAAQLQVHCAAAAAAPPQDLSKVHVSALPEALRPADAPQVASFAATLSSENYSTSMSAVMVLHEGGWLRTVHRLASPVGPARSICHLVLVQRRLARQ